MLQTIRHLLIRPKCFRLERQSPVGFRTRVMESAFHGAHNNASERAMRHTAVGRKNWLFAGSKRGGETMAILTSLVYSAKLDRLDTFADLRDVFKRLPGHPTSRLPDPLLHLWAPPTQ